MQRYRPNKWLTLPENCIIYSKTRRTMAKKLLPTASKSWGKKGKDREIAEAEYNRRRETTV